VCRPASLGANLCARCNDLFQTNDLEDLMRNCRLSGPVCVCLLVFRHCRLPVGGPQKTSKSETQSETESLQVLECGGAASGAGSWAANMGPPTMLRCLLAALIALGALVIRKPEAAASGRAVGKQWASSGRLVGGR